MDNRSGRKEKDMKIIEYAEHLYILEDERVRQFLFVGEQEALLIDTGFADSHVFETVRAITDVPVQVLLTHGDPDHSGGVLDFGSGYLHEGDWPLIQSEVTLFPLKEGDTFCCAGYQLETIELPGHTKGSVAFLDKKRKWLFVGDTVQKEGPIYLFGDHRDLPMYLNSLQRLQRMADQFELIFPSHGLCPIDPIHIKQNWIDACALENHACKNKEHPTLPCKIYFGRWTQFYYDR